MTGLVLAAAGTGSRFGSDIPKQFTQVEGKPLYLRALECFSSFFDQAVIVIPKLWKQEVENQVRLLAYRDELILEVGGPRRQDSVCRGLRRLSEGIEIVLVHDAARPFTSTGLISRVVEETRRHQACIPVLPVANTIKEICNGRVVRTLDRKSLGLVQTPQGFEINLLKRAFVQAEKDGFCGTDEAMLVERLGLPVHVVTGERTNAKVTWEDDLLSRK